MSFANGLVRAIATVHRYLGIAMALFFAMWFITGAVMLFVPYPALTEAQRLASLVPIELNAQRVAPLQAINAIPNIGEIQRIRLTNTGDGPAYRVTPQTGVDVVVDAVTGRPREITAQSAQQIALRYFARGHAAPVTATVAALRDYDQWTVHQRFDTLRPLYRIDLDDANRTSVYVSSRSSEVVHQTTRYQRSWNYAGSVLHWIYFTPLRKNHGAWDQTVWWLSLTGIVIALSGACLGIVRFRNPQRAAQPSQNAALIRLLAVSPFRGLMAWHHVLGIFAALFVLSWIFSGWLSMDHGRLFSRPEPGRALLDAWRGAPLRDLLAQNLSTISLPETARELEWVGVGAQLIAVVRNSENEMSVLRAGSPSNDALSPETIRRALETALQSAQSSAQILAVRTIESDDPYTHLKHEALPSLALRATLSNGTWIHIDPRNGTLLEVMSSDRRTYRWLFNGLHSLDFPALTSRPALWWILMITLLTLGFALSVTAVILGWRYVSTHMRSARAPQRQSVRE